MRNLLDEVKNLLEKDKRLTSNGKLLKNKIMELALKLDVDLLKLLLSEANLKRQFFKDIDGTLVFDQEKFIKFVNNKEFLPDSYTAFKNRIGLTTDAEYLGKKKDVVLSWPYKDCILEGGAERPDEGSRSEVFWNQILAPDQIDRLLDPKVFTNFERIDEKGGHHNPKLKPDDNLIMKGNNLLVLHSIKRKFRGKVKLIYIDPPYNIGNDEFNYNDRFNHSTWLTFMKNRLEVAKELLGMDGIIFVQIDHHELAHLKVLMDEIFENAPSGKRNFVQYVQIKASVGAAFEYQNPFMPKNCEYGLIYAKNYDERRYKPIWVKSEVDRAYDKIILNPEERNYRKWKIGNVMDEFVKEYGKENEDEEELLYDFVFNNIERIFRIISPKAPGKGLRNAMEKSKKDTWAVYKRSEKEDILCYSGGMVRFYSKNLEEDINGDKIIGRELGSLWTDISWTGIAPEGGVKLKAGKKPEKLLRRIIHMATEPGDIVLDFFLGSGTTAAVAHKMGRRYIGIEQLDYGKNDSVVRLRNVINGDQTGISKDVNWNGGGSFVYCELLKWNQEFLDKARKAKSKKELMEIWKEMKEKAFLSYKVDPKAVDENAGQFDDLSLRDQKRFLTECLDKNQLYVNLSEIDDEQYGVSEDDKRLNRQFYG